MFAELLRADVWRFGILVGFGATLILDGWCLVMRLVGVTLFNWDMLALRLAVLLRLTRLPPPASPAPVSPQEKRESAILRGEVDVYDIIFSHTSYRASRPAPAPARAEVLHRSPHSGWLPFMESPCPLPTPGPISHFVGLVLRYMTGILYALLQPLVWGGDYLRTPHILPAIMTGFLLPTLACLGLLVPLMGGGFFASRSRRPDLVQSLIIAGHAIFTLALYLLAHLLKYL